MKKKILIISGEFIPYTQSIGGVIRLISFIYSLKKHDIKILSFKKKYYGNFGFKKFISHAKINYIVGNNDKVSDYIFSKVYKYIHFISKLLFSNIFYLLAIDNNFFNQKKYISEIKKTLEEFKPDYVLISGPPFSLFKLVNVIKKINNNVKIILDYRDGWTQRVKSTKFFFIKKILEKYEKKILNSANLIFCATQQIYKDISLITKNKKIILLKNGYWKLSAKKKVKKKKNISIGYFGLISDDSFGYRDIKVIYNSLDINNKINFSFYGNSLIKDNKIRNYKKFKFFKNISYFDTQVKMRNFDYLLILHTEKSTASEVVTGKFYEYLSSRVPIIVVSNGETEVGKIVRKYKLGYVINYNISSLVTFFKNLKNKKFKPKDIKNIKRFSRFEQNKKLFKMFSK